MWVVRYRHTLGIDVSRSGLGAAAEMGTGGGAVIPLTGVADERGIALRLTDPDPDVRDRARNEEYSQAYEPFLLSELGRLLADDTRADSWPHCVHWIEHICSHGFYFDELASRLRPFSYRLPYEESASAGRMSPEEYRDMMDLLRAESREATRGLIAGLGLTGHPGPPRFATTSDPGLPPPGTDPETWRAIAGAIAMLNSPLRWARDNAVEYLAGFGADIIETMHAVRRSRTRARRAALAVLADIGWDHVDRRGRHAAERLVHWRRRTEVLTPVHPDGAWFAVPVADRDAVLDAFDLRDPVPATMRMGVEAWRRAGSGKASELVYVSPVLDGWTLVFANGYGLPPGVDDEEHDFCARLSRRFVAAQWFATYDDGHDAQMWCAAEDGEVVAHWSNDLLVRFTDGGEILRTPPEEFDGLTAWLDARDPAGRRPTGRRTTIRGHTPDYDVGRPFRSVTVARRLSVSPVDLGPHVRVEGHGVLALPASRPEARYQGALPI
jgi:hypothetical protein